MVAQTDSATGAGHHASRQPPDGAAPRPRGSGNSRRRERRRLDKELDVAARHRRQVATDTYYHNPPKLDDIWICEFCEYERIFGEPPRALIRDYELKDRRLRQEVAERKRMLEKAKAKARKNKKSAKAAAKASNAAGQTPEQVQAEVEGEPPQGQHGSHSTQSEENYGDDYDDGYSQPPPPPPPGPIPTDPGDTRAPLPPWPGPGT